MLRIPHRKKTKSAVNTVMKTKKGCPVTGSRFQSNQKKIYFLIKRFTVRFPSLSRTIK